MNDTTNSRKKIGLKAKTVPTPQPATPIKRGVRKRGGAPAQYVAPAGSFVQKETDAPRRPRPPREDDSRPKREWSERPPRKFGDDDTRPARSPRPPRAAEGEAPRRSFSKSRDESGAPPKREWSERPPRKFAGDDTRPARTRGAMSSRAVEIDAQGVQTFFATCPRGLEAVLREELLALRVQGIEPTAGGALFKGSLRSGLEANLESRVASRVLWKLTAREYRNEDDVFALARGIDWPKLFPVDQTIKVQCTAIHSPLTSIDFVALRVKDAICDSFRDAVGSRPNVDTSMPNQRIHVFLTAREATIYLDVSGEALFKRGYRRDGLVAPIRENLAAGILRLIKWSPTQPLLDPMCGSGTFLTEALLMASNTAPGLRRRNAHERWSLHPVDEFHAMKDAARARIRVPETLKLYARDTNDEAVRQTRAHIASLGGTAALDFATCSALDLSAPGDGGMIVANPPYGIRLGNTEELASMYPQFARVLSGRFATWTSHFITADLTMPRGLGLKPQQEWRLKNGALDCKLFSFAAQDV